MNHLSGVMVSMLDHGLDPQVKPKTIDMVFVVNHLSGVMVSMLDHGLDPQVKPKTWYLL